MKKRSLIILALAISLYATILFFFVTGSVLGWGKWYSQSTIYRSQTEALLSGHVYLSTNPTDMTYDFVLYNGKIQQVWGLGVPFLRLPFEIGARIFGFKAFSDRLVIFFYMWLTSFLVFLSAYFSGAKAGLKLAGQIISAVLLTMIVTLLPAVVALARTRFIVYEEAILYGYLMSIIVLALTPLVLANKRWVLPFVFFCGFLGFFRPTVLVYGAVASLLLLIFSKTYKRKAEIVAVFLIGCALLGFSNYSRFGNFSEFGHHMNIDVDPVMNNQMKFDPFFADITFPTASKELFGILFMAPRFNDVSSLYATNLFTFQADDLRWRNFYSHTFNLIDFWLVIIALAIIFWLILRRNFLFSLRQLLSQDFLVWSVLSFVILFGFYLRLPIISSRYVVDFSASILGMLFAVFFFLASRKVWWGKYLAFTAMGFYIFFAILDDGNWARKTQPMSEPIDSTQLADFQLSKTDKIKPIGGYYSYGENIREYGIFGDGVGWNNRNGSFQSSILIFTQNMKYLKLAFHADPSGLTASDFEVFKSLEVKIGNTHILHPTFNFQKNGNIEVVFSLPEEYKNTPYTLSVFIKMLPDSRIQDTESRLSLMRIEWR